jgi:hypothetical protein
VPGVPQASDPFAADWLVVENGAQPGELVTIQAGADKYALVFTDPETAGVFLADLHDEALIVSSLANWVLKESYLTAAGLIGATRVIFDYRRGQHDAVSAPLSGLLEFVRGRIGSHRAVRTVSSG